MRACCTLLCDVILQSLKHPGLLPILANPTAAVTSLLSSTLQGWVRAASLCCAHASDEEARASTETQQPCMCHLLEGASASRPAASSPFWAASLAASASPQRPWARRCAKMVLCGRSLRGHPGDGFLPEAAPGHAGLSVGALLYLATLWPI